MSFRNHLFASSALLFVSLCGVSSVNAADTDPIVRETCARETYTVRHAGHPGKKILMPVRQVKKAAGCAVSSSPGRVLYLASFLDAPGGEALVSGRTELAMEQAYAKRAGRSPGVLTNRCVAHTVLRQWTEARESCDAAVDSTLRQRDKVSSKQIAAAYSNRAVLNWLLSDEVAAQSDLAKARRFAPGASYVARNREATDSRPSLAVNRTPAG